MICFKRIHFLYIFIPLLLVLVISSCEQQTKDNKPQVAQEVVSVKITPIKKEPVKTQADKTIDQPVTESKENIAVSVQIDTTNINPINLSKKDIEGDKAANLDISSTSVIVPETETNVATSENSEIKNTDKKNETDKPANESLLLPETSMEESDEEKLFYIAKGKIDPFEPLIKEKTPVEQAQEAVEESVPERILTPLEKLDFSQIKLVAILNRESGSVAMVQEATGKGYIVNIGTYMGRNSGQVTSIDKDKIVIKEKIKDYKGNIVDNFQELKLNKLDDKG